MTYRTWTLGRFVLVLSLALGAAVACGGGSDPADSMGGGGGVGPESGGTPSTSTGGTLVSSGGTAGAEGGTAGEGGTGSTDPDDPELDARSICATDDDCAETNQVCAGFRRVCVDCATSDDCETGEICVRNTCEMRGTCEDSLDCPNTDLVCVEAGGGGPGPGEGQGLCLECASSVDCADEESCVENTCVRACASDKDCTPLGLLCNFDTSSCVECLDSSRCAAGEYCGDGACLEAVCTPGESVCFNDGIATCNEAGSGYGDIDPCFDSTCEVVDGEATCPSQNFP